MLDLNETLPCGHSRWQHDLSIVGSRPLPTLACRASATREQVVREIAIESSARLDGADWRTDMVVGSRAQPYDAAGRRWPYSRD